MRLAGLKRGWAPAALGLGVLMFAGAAPAAPAAKPAAAKPAATTPAGSKAYADAVAGLERRDGLLPLYVDRPGGRVLVALPAPDADGISGRYLYQTYLRAALGSTPVGLDRSQPGDTQVLRFRRVGKKVLAEFENWSFRAEHGSADEKRAVAESFPISTIWSADVVAEGPDGTLLIDATGFLVRDALNISTAMKNAKQGGFSLYRDLSWTDMASVQAFPENVEVDVSETFNADDAGSEVRGIVPDARAMTLVIHHSLIKLPEPGYQRRLFDPRGGAFNQLVTDYSAPLDQPLAYRLAQRFRLEKTDPTAARSRVKKPIVFYVDRSAPEPVRQALIDGASWWAKAFDDAGFIDAFRVEVLPEGVSPLDARYNVINWVHRQTRGWSYGQGIVDPRTGEVVKGSVLLGSQRIRQDRMIFEGLEGAELTGKGGPNDPVQISLARLRQLAAHETGHALGFLHNFAGSTYDDRASVMDYPAPRVKITNGRLDFSDAYGVGVGSWDRYAVAWLYTQVPPGADAKATLDRITADAYAKGQRFVGDDESRPAGGAQPSGALWDDGTDSVAALDHVMEVRRTALNSFGLRNLPEGAAVADLKRVIVPIYLFHRYEIDAAGKLIGGVNFGYGVNGDGREASAPVDPAVQRAALAGLLRAVDPANLDLPDTTLALLTAGQSGGGDPQYSTELFDGTGPIFDVQVAADVVADMVFSNLFSAPRLNRLVDMSSRDPSQPGVQEVLDSAIGAAFAQPAGELSRRAELRRRVQTRLVFDLAAVLEDKSLSPTAAAQIRAALVDLGKRLEKRRGTALDVAHGRYLADLLLEENGDRLRNLAAASRRAPTIPPGMPIGEDDWFGPF